MAGGVVDSLVELSSCERSLRVFVVAVEKVLASKKEQVQWTRKVIARDWPVQ